ncbi:hypothetical protein [Nonomuraea sp. NPDC049695]|uniref:hypothetical protein n=1 Tax=Nonomuraea sp. NPDC049695 TaxID=3154734 RepID=UPI003413B8EB
MNGPQVALLGYGEVGQVLAHGLARMCACAFTTPPTRRRRRPSEDRSWWRATLMPFAGPTS